MFPLIALLAACQNSPPPADTDARPVLPADDPAWTALGAYADSPAGFGADGWPAVRGRALHVAAALSRVGAQSAALSGDLPACADRYRAGAARIQTLVAEGVDPEGASAGSMLAASLDRAADTCAALATAVPAADAEGSAAPFGTAAAPEAGSGGAVQGSSAPPAASSTGLPALRARWITLALAFGQGRDVRAELTALAAEARALAASPPIDLSDPGRALADHLDALDPLYPSEPWGPYDGRARPVAAAALADAAAALAALPPGGPAPRALPADRTAPPTLPDPVLMPSRLASRASPVPLDALSIGAVPSGMALVDIAGWPLLRPEARLQRMGLDDPAHHAWLDVQAQGLATFPETDVPEAIQGMVERFDRLGHGSRWYNIVALRAGVTGTLASRGAWLEARKVLRADEAPRTLDATVPAYAAARWAVDARLALLSGVDPGASLEAAEAALADFLAHVRARSGSTPGGVPGSVAEPGGGAPR